MIPGVSIEKENGVYVRHEVPDEHSFSGRRVVFEDFLTDPTRFCLKLHGGELGEPEALVAVYPQARLLAFNVAPLDIKRIGRGLVPFEDMRTGAILFGAHEMVVVSGKARGYTAAQAEELTIEAGYRRRFKIRGKNFTLGFWPLGSF
ncbi:hypothetical protein HYW41_05295 [Candidatus Daviesbacteria bacterium]|nr:hypothetical protein [Candidatus Daviesbacteria bacterium]